MNTAEDVGAVLRYLEGTQNAPERRALIGFDGYVDTLYRVVKTRGGEHAYFQTIAEYGARVLQAAGKSADIDLHRLSRAIGGNAPLMANGLARLGVQATLMGALGYPELHPVFEALHPDMRVHSFAEPCHTIALEFDDGKIMMGDVQASRDIRWERLVSVVGEETVISAIASADLIAMLNWSAHRGMRGIARGIAGVLAGGAPNVPKKLCFFDLSDPTSLPEGELRQCLQDIQGFGDISDSVLSLNENEACAVFRALYPQTFAQDTLAGADVDRLGETARAELGLRLLCIHTNASALGYAQGEAARAEGFHVKKPTVSTGGGDNFNAGLCSGLLAGLSLPQCLLLASAASSYFVVHARSADRAALAAHVRACA